MKQVEISWSCLERKMTTTTILNYIFCCKLVLNFFTLLREIKEYECL